MAELIKGCTANELWQKSKKLLEDKAAPTPSQKGGTKEVLHVMLELENPREKWTYKRVPVISVAFALVEVMWICNGQNDTKTIDFWNKLYKETAADEGSDIYHGAYGYRLKTQHGIDQMERAYQALHAKPENRQTVMLYWDPPTDMPNDDGRPKSKDIPCNICSLLKIRDGRLEWTQIMRSNDLFLGLPYNLVQFTSLQEIMAGWLGVKVGSYTHFSDSLHLYDEYERVDKVSYAAELDEIENPDSLSIGKSAFDAISKDIMARMQRMMGLKSLADEVEREQQVEELRKLSTLNSDYAAYNNILYIIGARAAFKLTHNNLARELVKKCKNPVYTKLMQLKYAELCS